MSATHTAAPSAEISRSGIFGRAAPRLFGVLSRKFSSFFDHLADSGREIPSEVFRFPLF